ncbi:MAG: trypsin-like serine protease [Gemmatimonadales bacterium]
MPRQPTSSISRPLHQAATPPRDLREAKDATRDRLFHPAGEVAPEAFSLRKAKRFRPAPAVNLIGVGIGEKVTAGHRTGELCVKVYVAKKYAKSQVRPADRIPARVAGVPTDVEGIGYPTKFQIPQRQRTRPVVGGLSTGLDFQAVNFQFAGTLGVVVADRAQPSRLLALSNNHVFADENRVPIGAGVVQPGTLDGGANADRVARLAQFIPLLFDNKRNWHDSAVAEFLGSTGVNRSIMGIGTPVGAGRSPLNSLVRKSGRTTGLTEGVVRAVNFDVQNIQYDQGFVRVDDVMVIEGMAGSFSRPGDSGSAIVDAAGRVVGLLFAGSPAVTFAIPIQRILRRFRIRIAG